MKPPRDFSLLSIINLSAGFLGIQFGWGLQMANMSAIYQFLGAGEEDIAFLWLAAPVTGLLVQPVIGYYSDRTWNRLGRRRPFFLVGAILASLALIAMPNSSTLWMAAGLLWVLDASVNISMEPFRAFVGDLLPPHQRKVGFAMQSLLIGLGAVTASKMPTILVDWLGFAGGSPDVILTTATGSERAIDLDTAIPAAVHVSFYIGSALFLATVLYTILTTPERPPADMEAFRRMKAASGGVGGVFREIAHGIGAMPRTMRQLAGVQFFTWFALFCLWIYFVPGVGKEVFDGEPLGTDLSALNARDETGVLRYLAAAKLALEGARVADSHAGATQTVVRLSTAEYLNRVRTLAASPDLNADLTPMEKRNPLYTTVTAVLIEGGTDIEAQSIGLGDRLDRSTRYEAGTRAGGDYFAVYNGVAFFFAFLLLALVRTFRARTIHIICLALGGIGLVLAGLGRSPVELNVAMVLLGIAWASILSMPYAMLANAIPAEKMGFFMGVFNFFIVLPQILASTGLGWIVLHFFDGRGMLVVVLGGVSMLVAAGLTLLVRTEPAPGNAPGSEATIHAD